METQVLGNKDQFPTEDIIFQHLGKTKNIWIKLFQFIHERHSDFKEEWRYYNDGKSWLLKITKKTKTICWVSIIKDGFRMSLYFGDKAEKLISESDLPKQYKDQFFNGKKFGKIRAITTIFKNEDDIKAVKILMEIKEKLK